jgi:hypothetical protein
VTASRVGVTVPFRFDTTYIGTLVFRAAAWLDGILLLGLVGKLLVGDPFTAVGIAFLCLFVGGFGLVIFRKAGGSVGTLTLFEVTVEPARLYGFTAEGPRGRFPTTHFGSICVEWRPRVSRPGVQMSAGINERIILVGREGTPDIEIARLTDESGRAFARELGGLLSLPVEERPGPGVHGARRT